VREQRHVDDHAVAGWLDERRRRFDGAGADPVMHEGRSMILKNERGLTLAEILVAVAIIGLGLVGLAVVIPVSSYGVQEGNQLSTATFPGRADGRARARVGLDQLAGGGLPRAFPAGNAAPVPTGATCVGAAAPTATQFPDETSAAGVSGYPRYTRIVRVTNCGATPCAGVTDAGMRLVQVTVTYTPLSAAGVSPTPKTVMLEWLVSQK
jgi:prepilin-type N-terminal cleavage/methylation domain-containing protein